MRKVYIYLVVVVGLCGAGLIVHAQQQTTKTGTWADIMGRAFVTGATPNGFNPNAVTLMGNDAAMLGLGSSAKEYLKSKYDRATMNNGCVRSKDKAINGLDTKFAECAAKFLQTWERTNGSVRITSAFRDYNDQICVCRGATGLCAAPGRSNHQRGTAIDVWPQDTSDAGMRKFHLAASSFGGVHFPLGMRDRPHMEPSGSSCASGDGGSGAQTQNTPNQQNGQQSAQAGQQPSPQSQNPNPYGPWNSQGQPSGQTAGTGSSTGGGVGGGGSASPTQGSNSSGGAPDAVSALMPLSVATVTCSPDTVDAGSELALTWSCPAGSIPRVTTQRKTRLTLHSTGAEGSEVVHPPSSTVYTLSCIKNTMLVAQGECRVVVRPTRKTSVLTITTSDVAVAYGDSVTVSWTAKNVQSGSCTVSGTDGIEASGARGTVESNSLREAHTTFVLACTALDGQRVEESAAVTVRRMSSRVNDL